MRSDQMCSGSSASAALRHGSVQLRQGRQFWQMCHSCTLLRVSAGLVSRTTDLCSPSSAGPPTLGVAVKSADLDRGLAVGLVVIVVIVVVYRAYTVYLGVVRSMWGRTLAGTWRAVRFASAARASKLRSTKPLPILCEFPAGSAHGWAVCVARCRSER